MNKAISFLNDRVVLEELGLLLVFLLLVLILVLGNEASKALLHYESALVIYYL